MHTLYKKHNFQTSTVYFTFCICMHLFLMRVCMSECVWHVFHLYTCLCESVCSPGSVAMLPSRYVRGELVSVLTPVAAEVALEGVSEAVAAHVNGVHDVVQEENAAVFAPVRPHLFPVGRHHLEAL